MISKMTVRTEGTNLVHTLYKSLQGCFWLELCGLNADSWQVIPANMSILEL